MAQVKLIAMDMDGTLLDRQGNIFKENVEALKEAKKRGVAFAICSGRYPENASFVVLDSGLSCPVIGTNGAEILETPLGKVLFSHDMDKKAAKEVNDVLLSFNASYFTFGHKLITTSSQDARHHSELHQGEFLREQGAIRFCHGPEAILNSLEEGIAKFFVSDTGNLKEIYDALSKIDHIVLTRSSPINIEVMPVGVDKGTGVLELATHLGIKMEEVMALGDQENDLPMLERVGFGVAMGNAPQYVKDKARYQTLPYDQAGVAHAIEKFVLSV